MALLSSTERLKRVLLLVAMCKNDESHVETVMLLENDKTISMRYRNENTTYTMKVCHFYLRKV